MPLIKTDPAELFALFGRFFSSIFLMFMTLFLVFRGLYILAAITSLASIMTQRATILLYRRLRDERAAILDAWEAEHAPTNEVPTHAS